MRHLRLGLGLLAATSVIAIGAAPAMAHEFIASTTNKTHGTSETEQLFKFGPFKIKCLKASAKGAIAAGTTQTYATAIKYSKCLTSAFVGSTKHTIFLPTKWLTPLAIEYHANGFVETGGEIEEVEGKAVILPGSAELKVNTGKTEEFEKSECHISWPEQTIPLKATKEPEGEFSSATFSNEPGIPRNVNAKFPDGLQHYIGISNAFKGIKFELEGEPCEEWGKEEGPEGGGGTYTGSFPQILNGGNLEYF